MTMIHVSAFRCVPPFAQGLVRDLRVRWALEEAGVAYEERLLDDGPQGKTMASYRRLQPFGQVPAFEEGDLVLFESGAIVLHIAERSDALMPATAEARERIKSWMFAALNTVEPPITMLVDFIDRQPGGVGGAIDLRRSVVEMVESRLDSLAAFLGAAAYLVGDRFSAADLLTTTVLRNLRGTDLVSKKSVLEAYRQRCEARPAFAKALEAQMATFAKNAPLSCSG